MSDDFDDDLQYWCGTHAVARTSCRCPYDAPASGLWPSIIDRGGLATLPEPTPLIAGTLDQRTMAMLFGHFGTGKSFLALDWAACIATGKSWQGRAVVQGSVLYVAAEGAYGLHKRLSAWEYAWGREIPSDCFHVAARPVNLTNRSDTSQLVEIVYELAPRLVVFDTLARCAVGADENSAQDMGIVVDNLDRIKVAMDGGVAMLVHHTGKDRKTSRGSVALEAGVDTVYRIEGESNSLTLERTKRKDGPLADVIGLRLTRPEGADSVILESTGAAWTAPVAEKLQSTFASTFATTGASAAQLREASNLPRSSFYKALNLLVESGHLINEGTKSRPFYVMGGSHE